MPSTPGKFKTILENENILGAKYNYLLKYSLEIYYLAPAARMTEAGGQAVDFKTILEF